MIIKPGSIVPSISFFMSVGLSLYILACDPRKGLNRTFFALGLAAGIFNFSQVMTHYSVDTADLLFWTRVSFLGGIVLPLIAVRFCREFFGPGSINHWIQPALYPYTLIMIWLGFTPALLKDVDFTAGDRLVRAGWAMFPLSAVVLATVGYLIWRFLADLSASSDPDHRNRLKYLALGAAGYLVAGGIDVARRLEIFTIFTVPIADYATMFFMILLAHVIRRHKLIEISEFIGHGIAVSASMILLASIFILIEEFLESLISSAVSPGGQNIWPGVAAAMTIAVLFYPLRRWLGRIMAGLTGASVEWWRQELEIPDPESLTDEDRKVLSDLAVRLKDAAEGGFTPLVHSP